MKKNLDILAQQPGYKRSLRTKQFGISSNLWHFQQHTLYSQVFKRFFMIFEFWFPMWGILVSPWGRGQQNIIIILLFWYLVIVFICQLKSNPVLYPSSPRHCPRRAVIFNSTRTAAALSVLPTRNSTALVCRLWTEAVIGHYTIRKGRGTATSTGNFCLGKLPFSLFTCHWECLFCSQQRHRSFHWSVKAHCNTSTGLRLWPLSHSSRFSKSAKAPHTYFSSCKCLTHVPKDHFE